MSELADAVGAVAGQRRTRRWRRFGLLVATTMVAGYTAICAVLFFVQDQLIYVPKVGGYGRSPADMGLPFEDLTLTAAGGTSIAAWYIPHPGDPATVIYCHGNGGSLPGWLGAAKSLYTLGFSVLLFDYPGYGRSGGRPTEAGLYAAADAAWDFLTDQRGLPASRIVVFGRSLGGAVAIDLAARHTPAALVVESTFTSMVDMGRQEYPWLPIALLCTHRYDSLAKIGRVRCPKLFFHGADDELVPLAQSRRLFDAAEQPKELIVTPGGHNTSGFEHDWESMQQFRAWLQGVVPSSGPA